MSVRIRMKRLGRKHRPFFRICAIDSHAPRDGRVIEELGHYDPLVPEVDARARLNEARVDYWLSVGAEPSEKVAVLIGKYGSQGTHRAAQQAALERMKHRRRQAPEPVRVPSPKERAAAKAAAEAAAAEAAAAEAAAAEAAAVDAAAVETAAGAAEAAAPQEAPGDSTAEATTETGGE